MQAETYTTWCLLHYAGEQLTYTVQHDNLSSLSFTASANLAGTGPITHIPLLEKHQYLGDRI